MRIGKVSKEKKILESLKTTIVVKKWRLHRHGRRSHEPHVAMPILVKKVGVAGTSRGRRCGGTRRNHSVVSGNGISKG